MSVILVAHNLQNRCNFLTFFIRTEASARQHFGPANLPVLQTRGCTYLTMIWECKHCNNDSGSEKRLKPFREDEKLTDQTKYLKNSLVTQVS